MAEYIHLIGAEEVSKAANTMRTSAERMISAATAIDHSLEMFLRRFEELVYRLEEANKTPEERVRSAFHWPFFKTKD